MDGDPGPDEFERAIGDTFTATDVEVPLPLVLEQVVRHTPSPGAPRADPFTLTFVTQVADVAPQRTFTLVHDGLGSMAIFLVPIGPGPDGRLRYEAVFN